MRTAPVKSHQPLHNFSLSFLKWGQKNGNQRCHRFTESSNDSPSPPTVNHRSSSSPRPESETDLERRKVSIASRSVRNRLPFSSCSSQKQQPLVSGSGGGGDVEKACDDGEGEGSMAKPWNLRTRKAIAKDAAEYGESQGCGAATAVVCSTAGQSNENFPKSMRLRGYVDVNGSERKGKKSKFWISLTRDEIEEDVYALTGLRPARRPKKRPRTIQKLVDNVSPGLYLVGTSADSYRVHEQQR